MLDTQHGAWHAGNRYGNKHGIGVEISNAYYLKYQDWYQQRGFGERPVLSDTHVHGKKLDPFTGFYPVQLEALKALWKAANIGLDIPLDYPKDSNGNLDTGANSSVAKGKFNGFCNHYNFTKKKIDCAGLAIDSMLEDVRATPMYVLD